MKRRDDFEVAAWLNKAEGDLRMARLAIETEDPLWDQACFPCQQAAEKSLKAISVANEQPVPRTHDLVRLIELLAEYLPKEEELGEHAAVLTPFGVSPRYPTFLAGETETQARDALRRAQEIYARVTSLLE
jgi:HEPN domain-containing protein